jgi:pentatricopeptide repeat protein
VKLAERAADHYREKCGRLTLAMYSALMKVYSQARLFHKACDLYELLIQDGVKLDNVAYGCLIRAAVESGRLDLARKLFQESGNPDLINYMSLIRAAGRERNLAKALSLLKDLEQSPIPIDTTAYNCVLDVCVACGEQKAAKDLFKRMRDADHVDVISYNTYLKTLLSKNNGGFGSAADIALVLQEMRSQGLKPNPVTYNSLINAAISRGDLQGAWQYVEDMEMQGVQVDAFTCSILMKGIKHSSKRDDVEKILALIDRAKVVPDEVLVNSLLDACVRLRNGPLLTRVLQQFRATGVVPSLHAYATLIKAYGHARQIDQVWALWQEVTAERGIAPNEEVFSCMADACVSNGDLAGAVRVLRDVKQSGLHGSGSHNIFSGLIRACLQRKDLAHAMELYEEMAKNDIPCSLTSFNILIDALARAGDMTQVARLFRDMCQKNVSPDLVTYSTVIKGYCVKGDLEPAMQLFTLMRKRGIKPDGILFNSILDGCAHKQMRTLTEQVLNDMEEEGVNPSNFTLSILVKLYGRCGDIDQALDVVETYPKKYGFELNAQVYTCLMSACISNKQLSKSLQVLEQMKMAKCTPDGKTYQTLLNGCLKHDDLVHAVKIVDDAFGLDAPDCPGARALLNQEAIDTLIFTIQRRGRMSDLGEPLVKRLRDAGFAISASSKSNSAPVSRLHAARVGERVSTSHLRGLPRSP